MIIYLLKLNYNYVYCKKKYYIIPSLKKIVYYKNYLNTFLLNIKYSITSLTTVYLLLCYYILIFSHIIETEKYYFNIVIHLFYLM